MAGLHILRMPRLVNRERLGRRAEPGDKRPRNDVAKPSELRRSESKGLLGQTSSCARNRLQVTYVERHAELGPGSPSSAPVHCRTLSMARRC